MMSDHPTIVCLCGSTRYRAEYEAAFRNEEHDGRICLTVPCFKTDSCCKTLENQKALDHLHKAKIRLADEILVLSRDGYFGESTRSEVAYAVSLGKTVRYLEPEHALSFMKNES